MREKTRDELVNLASRIVKGFKLDRIIDSNEFLEVALDLAEENDIEIGRPTLIKYESELKRMCKSIEKEDLTEDKFHQFLEELECKSIEKKTLTEDKFDQFLEANVTGKRLIMTINFYDDGSYEKIKPQQVQTTLTRVPEYSMFAEGEDGLIVLKGTYKGKNLDEINTVAGFDTAKRGWAKYMLQQDKNLTDDDRDVFTKIMGGYL